jgi:hypothetical protein
MSRLSAARASKKARAWRGGAEHDGLGDLDLAHRDVPPVAGGPVVGRQRQRQARPPALGEHGEGARSEAVTDLLQGTGVRAGGEAVGQLPERDPGAGGLALGPLVAVHPNLARVGEVRADLDERRPEVDVPQVEVVAGDTPLDPLVGEPHRAGVGGRLGTEKDPLVLLRDADRDHLRPTRRRRPAHQRHHLVDLAFRPGAVGQHTRPVLALLAFEVHHRDPVGLGERRHRPAKGLSTPLQQRRRGNRLTLVLGQEAQHLTTDHQVRHHHRQVDPVQAVDLQGLLPVQQLVDGDRVRPGQPRRHGGPLRSEGNASTARINPASRLHQSQPPTSAVRGGASLVR